MRIRGEMLDYLRSKDWLPVSLRKKIRRYEEAVSALENKLGRAASDDEITSKLGLSLEEFSKLNLEVSAATVIPLDDYTNTCKIASSGTGPEAQTEDKELRETLAQAIYRLPENERRVISLYYYESLTLKEIALILKLSDARISQLHTKAVFRLRGYLARIKASLI